MSTPSSSPSSSSSSSSPRLSSWQQREEERCRSKDERAEKECVFESASKAFADSYVSHRADMPLLSVFDESGDPTSLFFATESQSLGLPIILANVPESSPLHRPDTDDWRNPHRARTESPSTSSSSSSSSSSSTKASPIPPDLAALIRNVSSLGTYTGELWGPLGAHILSYLSENPFSSNLESPNNVPLGQSTVVGKASFLANFRRLTGGIFDALTPSEWSGIVVAGGVIQCALDACVSHPSAPNISGTKLFGGGPAAGWHPSYELETSPNSDVDVWLHGLTEAQARDKIMRLFTVFSAAATSKGSYEWEGFTAKQRAKLHKSLALEANRPLAVRTPSKLFLPRQASHFVRAFSHS